MKKLTGNCAINFKLWAVEKYGYSDVYYLGLPVILEFFDQVIDWELAKGNPAIGEMKERIIIAKTLQVIDKMNELYNAEYETIKQGI
jgi:hypothetical protein